MWVYSREYSIGTCFQIIEMAHMKYWKDWKTLLFSMCSSFAIVFVGFRHGLLQWTTGEGEKLVGKDEKRDFKDTFVSVFFSGDVDGVVQCLSE